MNTDTINLGGMLNKNNRMKKISIKLKKCVGYISGCQPLKHKTATNPKFNVYDYTKNRKFQFKNNENGDVIH